jgi:hypothetical protein
MATPDPGYDAWLARQDQKAARLIAEIETFLAEKAGPPISASETGIAVTFAPEETYVIEVHHTDPEVSP